jgi:DNA-binding FadR family transcriptional regulator
MAGATVPPMIGPKPRTAVKMSEAVARALLNHIQSEGLRPGDPLPNERVAIEWLGVSRGSLREGLRLLESHGVISVRPGPGGGPVVRAADPQSFAGATTLLMQFMRVPFSEVLEARIAFEPSVAGAAAGDRTEEQLPALAAAVEAMAASGHDRTRYMAAYNGFHRGVAEATGNRVLELAGVTFQQVWGPVHSDVRFTPASLELSTAAHRNLYRAIERGDRERASEASRRHLTGYREFLLEHQPALLRRQVEWATGSPQ